jgi:hypothetical protein
MAKWYCVKLEPKRYADPLSALGTAGISRDAAQLAMANAAINQSDAITLCDTGSQRLVTALPVNGK